MSRRSGAGGKPAKARSHKTNGPKRSAAKKTRRVLSPADQETTVEQLARALNEALEQQAATAEVLSLISGPSADIGPVFDAIVRRFALLCGSMLGAIFTFDGKLVHYAGGSGFSPKQLREMRAKYPVPVGDPSVLSARAILAKAPVHIDDVLTDPHYDRAHAAVASWRRMLAVPVLLGGEPIGAIVAAWAEPGATPKQHEHLLQVFATHAVIAIENTRLLSELRQSLQQQTATADVLKVISRSTFDLQPVLDTLVESATRLCEAYDSVILLRDGDRLRVRAHYGPIPVGFVDWPIGRGWVTGRAFIDQKPIHVHDLQAAMDEYPDGSAMAIRLGHRTILATPLVRKGEAIGALMVRRTEVRPFTDTQIELIKTFADQAMIAIENVRLFDAEQRRTRELSEALEQQTATSEVLRIISSSPGELEPVFQAMLANAVRICDAKFGVMFRHSNEDFSPAAFFDTPTALAEFIQQRKSFQPVAGTNLDRMCRTKEVIRVIDDAAEPVPSPAAKFGGARSLIAVPMLKENALIGGIVIYRQEIRPFTDKQIELVSNFAAQSVIAIENTRLLNELRESLQQQTATADVLKVISSSPGELGPVFQAMLENATRLCEASYSAMWLCEGDGFRSAAHYGALPAAWQQQWRTKASFRVHPDAPAFRAIKTRKPVHVVDLSQTAAYREGEPLVVSGVDVAGIRTMLTLPMFKDDEAIGAISIFRMEVRPFSDKQIELVSNFAAQAVIAIENTRLLNELRESLQQQTATADVLKVISSSPGDLTPVFDSILVNATRICEANFANLALVDGDELRAGATHGAPAAFAELVKPGSAIPRTTPVGRVIETKRPIHIADVQADETFRNTRLAKQAGARTTLGVPMLKDNQIIGAILIYRQEVRPFTDRQIALLSNFAAQAVIAIENARLLGELRESLQQQTATADVLKVISRSTFDLKSVLSTLVELATRLCEADMGNIARPKEGGTYQIEASYGQSAALNHELARQTLKTGKGSVIGRTALTGETVHILDAQTDPDYELHEALKLGGYRSMLGVPLLREGNLVGVFGLARRVVRPFTEKQIELVTTFADQAVIAIENVRLFDDVQAQKQALTEALEYQTATGEVLNVISRSTTDVQPVFDMIAESAARLCDAKYCFVYRFDGQLLHFVAHRSLTAEVLELNRAAYPAPPSRRSAAARAVLARSFVQIPDVNADPDFTLGPMAAVGDFRSVAAVPILRDGVPIGSIAVARGQAGLLPERQVELLKTFADQAVIAIENVRLFDEVQARTRELARSVEELKALGEVSQAVNSTLDLETVLTTIVGRAVQLSRTDAGAIYVFDEERKEFRLHATFGMSETMIAAIGDRHIGLGDANIGVAAVERKPVQVPDIRNEPAHRSMRLSFAKAIAAS